VNQITLDSIVDNINRLPSLPSIVNELIVALGNKSINVDDLAHGIEKDQALSARALRVANSPFYGMRQPIASIRDAIVVLGFRAVGSLVTTAALTNLFKTPEYEWFDQSAFWRQSLGTAICSRKLAQSVGGFNPEIGFTAGLLHDIGRLVLVVCCPKEYRSVVDWRNAHDRYSIDAEIQVLGVTHCQAGAALAKHWNLGPEICDAAAYHHAPPASDSPTIVDLVHVADILAHALDMARAPQTLVPRINSEAWQRLGLDWTQLAGTLADIELEFESYDSLMI
jgi:HD-like signal output (HDOD) protein